MGLILYLAVTLHTMDNSGPRGQSGGGVWSNMKSFGKSGLLKDVVMYIPVSLILTGYVLALSILINASNYNRNLTTGSNVVLNLPRVIFIILLIIFLHHGDTYWKTGVMVFMLFMVIVTGCAQAKHPGTSQLTGVLTFIVGLGATGYSIYSDIETGGGISGAGPDGDGQPQSISLESGKFGNSISEHVNTKYKNEIAQLEHKIQKNSNDPNKLDNYEGNLNLIVGKIKSSNIEQQQQEILLGRIKEATDRISTYKRNN